LLDADVAALVFVAGEGLKCYWLLVFFNLDRAWVYLHFQIKFDCSVLFFLVAFKLA
jgi:hypothetical protein